MAIHITNAAELRAIEDDMAGDYVLDNDIDLAGVDWRPIGATRPDMGLSVDLLFTGVFDGQGYTIRNLSCSYKMYDLDGCNGLFAFLGNDSPPANGVIKNLNLDTVTLYGEYAIGAVIGFIISGHIENCHVSNVSVSPAQTLYEIKNMHAMTNTEASTLAPGSLAVSGDYLYVVWQDGTDAHNRLEIYDIATNPTVPALVGSLYDGAGGASLRTPTSIAISGNYAFIPTSGTGAQGIEVVDITNKASPSHHAFYADAINLTQSGIAKISGTHLYVNESNGDLAIFNISNPASISFVKDVAVLTLQHLTISGNYLYVSTGTGLKIVDITTPASASVVGTLTGLINGGSIAVQGNYVYIMQQSSTGLLHVINISNKSNPVLQSSPTLFSNKVGVLIEGNRLFVGRTTAMSIVDISDPTLIGPDQGFGDMTHGGRVTVVHDLGYRAGYVYSLLNTSEIAIYGTFVGVAPNGSSSIGGIGGDCFADAWDTGDLTTEITDCSVTNLIINGNMQGSFYDVGGLLGGAGGDTDATNPYAPFIIDNCHVTGLNISGVYAPWWIGGITGLADAATINKCSVQGTITLSLGNTLYPWYDDETYNEAYAIGGLVGEAQDTKITNCFANVTISISLTADETYVDAIGGLVGEVDGTNEGCIIQNCYSEGPITITLTAGALTDTTPTLSTTNPNIPTSFNYPIPSTPIPNILESVECWGGGGGGGVNAEGEGGGGGGAYAKTTNIPIVPGQVYSTARGAGGSAGNAGGDTYFESLVIAKGGSGASGRTGGQGGQASASTGTTKYSGGNGGTSSGATAGGGGGGSSAGTSSDGNNGVDNSGATGGAGGTAPTGGFTGKAGGNNLANGGTFFDSAIGGGGGGAGGNASAGTIGKMLATYYFKSWMGVGGLVGTLYRDGTLENVFSVGTVTGPSGLTKGGFIGLVAQANSTFTNCAWWSGASTYAIGNDIGYDNKMLEDQGYGTDEPDNTAFYLRTHQVYAQT